MSVPSRSRCAHPHLLTIPSSHAKDVGYQVRAPQQLFTASTGSRKRIDTTCAEYLALHPAPLILPDDELAHDPTYSGQSFVSWKNEKERNVVDEGREVVYVAKYPELDQDMGTVMDGWNVPIIDCGDKHGVTQPTMAVPPPFEDVLAYLEAFFHGLPVKQLNDNLEFTTWEDRTCKSRRGALSMSKSRSKPSAPADPPLTQPPSAVGLSSTSANTTTRVRVRHLPATSNSPYLYQLNLNDILDHAIAILPSDAYALLLLVNHDLYEDEDDDFCVGRAYGGSRIAVVSGARYQPTLDVGVGVEPGGLHSWPASHCKTFVDNVCGNVTDQKKKKKQKRAADTQPPGFNTTPQESQSASYPLSCAIAAHTQFLNSLDLDATLARRSLYTLRLSLTSSHELLHCFGLDHCVYLACAMQGTASIAEDTRQPPYLCSVCENKLAAAIALRIDQGGKMEEAWWDRTEVSEWRAERRDALIRFCHSKGKAFGALEGWYKALIDVRLAKSD